ncbi:MAG: hypothetical protein RXR82_06345 [Nitrososphaeria archaeon]
MNAVRVQIYAHVSGGTGNLSVLINGAAPTIIKSIVGSNNTASFTNTSSALVFDAVLSLSGLSSPYTLSIEADNSTSGDTTYIDDVYAFQGLAITSTSATTVDQEETTPSNTILDEIGVTYYANAGAKMIVGVNRYTTATATVAVKDQWGGGISFSFPAANDAANTITVLPTNSQSDYGVASPTIPAGYNGGMTFTVTANVGASGDIIIIGFCIVAFGFNQITFPRGPHYGFVEAAGYAWQIGSLLIVDPQQSIPSYIGSSWGGSATIYTISGSGWLVIQAAQTIAIDEDEYLQTGNSANVIHRQLLVVILE